MNIAGQHALEHVGQRRRIETELDEPIRIELDLVGHMRIIANQWQMRSDNRPWYQRYGAPILA